jgi:hypothetical protein
VGAPSHRAHEPAGARRTRLRTVFDLELDGRKHLRASGRLGRARCADVHARAPVRERDRAGLERDCAVIVQPAPVGALRRRRLERGLDIGPFRTRDRGHGVHTSLPLTTTSPHFMSGLVPPKPETIGRVFTHLNTLFRNTADGDFNPADLGLIVDYPHVARYFAAAFPSAPSVWPASARPPPVAQLQEAITTVQTEVRTLSESLPKALADIKTYVAAAAQAGEKRAGHLPAVSPPSRPPARTLVPTRPARERPSELPEILIDMSGYNPAWQPSFVAHTFVAYVNKFLEAWDESRGLRVVPARITRGNQVAVTGAPGVSLIAMTWLAERCPMGPLLGRVLGVEHPDALVAPAKISDRWSKVRISGVPTGKSGSRGAFSPAELLASLREATPFTRDLTVRQEPRWIRRPELYGPGDVSSFSFAFKDPDGELLRKLCRSPVFVAGVKARASRWKEKAKPRAPAPVKPSAQAPAQPTQAVPRPRPRLRHRHQSRPGLRLHPRPLLLRCHSLWPRSHARPRRAPPLHRRPSAMRRLARPAHVGRRRRSARRCVPWALRPSSSLRSRARPPPRAGRRLRTRVTASTSCPRPARPGWTEGPRRDPAALLLRLAPWVFMTQANHLQWT